MLTFGSLLIAVETNTRSPHTIGLETATPATGVLQRMFSPVDAFHLATVGLPSATPLAFAPRNAGQFCPRSVVEATSHAKRGSARRMLLGPCFGERHPCDHERRDFAVLDLERDCQAGCVGCRKCRL